MLNFLHNQFYGLDGEWPMAGKIYGSFQSDLGVTNLPLDVITAHYAEIKTERELDVLQDEEDLLESPTRGSLES